MSSMPKYCPTPLGRLSLVRTPESGCSCVKTMPWQYVVSGPRFGTPFVIHIILHNSESCGVEMTIFKATLRRAGLEEIYPTDISNRLPSAGRWSRGHAYCCWTSRRRVSSRRSLPISVMLSARFGSAATCRSCWSNNISLSRGT